MTVSDKNDTVDDQFNVHVNTVVNLACSSVEILMPFFQAFH